MTGDDSDPAARAGTASAGSADTRGRDDELRLHRTRTGSAWAAAALGAVLVLLMLVFILQNGERVAMEFLWLDFTVPVGAGLLLAAVLGALVVVSLGAGRMLQLRLAARRHRKADRQASSGSPVTA